MCSTYSFTLSNVCVLSIPKTSLMIVCLSGHADKIRATAAEAGTFSAAVMHSLIHFVSVGIGVVVDLDGRAVELAVVDETLLSGGKSSFISSNSADESSLSLMIWNLSPVFVCSLLLLLLLVVIVLIN